MTNYLKATDDVMDVVETVMQSHHPMLAQTGVNVGALMVFAELDKHGDPRGHALKHHGVPALAVTKILSLKLRTYELPDAEIVIDGDRWGDLSEKERDALIDHELTHIELVEKDGVVQRDDLQRPKLRMRHHDYDFGWFAEVVERHGKSSIEHQQAQRFVDASGQLFLNL